ncbi:MAG TPA: hypothetical protein VKV74_14055 [Bryobacteraceae bacterium]|nr:hypothetical protein [Bryobacteraceae bacterium]
MMQDEFDRALSGEVPIVPSAGFVNGVMEAVRREASAPPPIPFPWKRALPGLAAGIVALAAMIAAVVKDVAHPASAVPAQSGWSSALAHAAALTKAYGIDWILLMVAITLACVTLSMRLTAGSKRTV